MSPNFHTARKPISYPLYGADFDPSNADFLLVGGGGGSSSSGVPNKITLIDTSRIETLHEITDIDLSKDEDSVTSLAVAYSDEASLTAYAGINGSVKDQTAGKNEHFRSFRIGLPAKRRKTDVDEKNVASSQGRTIQSQALTRAALFKSATGPKNEAYQRVLRVAPAQKAGGEQLAAIASGLGTKNEVLILRATPSPGLSNVVSRVDIENGEAADLDIIPVEDQAKSHVLSYCTDYDVFLQHIPSTSGRNIKEPIKVYSISPSNRRSKIRCLRWLNTRYIILLQNRPAGGGAELVILKTDKDYTQAQQVLTKIPSKSTKQAVGLDVCSLSSSAKGDQQFLVAVAGKDSSIEILSIDWLPGSGMTRFRQYTHIRNVHSLPITQITFSRFAAPALPVTKDTRPQYVRLASVSVDSNVVVQTLPLRPYPPTHSKEPRYVLIPPPETFKNAVNIFVALFIIGIVAFCMQIFCEIRGVVPPTLNAPSWLSLEWQQKIAIPYGYYSGRPFDNMPGPVIPESMPPIIENIIETATSAASAGATLLQDLVAEQHPTQQIVMRDTSTSDAPDYQPEIVDKDGETLKNDDSVKQWDQLSEREKRGWKKRLADAGHWTEKQGESVLKGILFSELGAAVGAAVRGG